MGDRASKQNRKSYDDVKRIPSKVSGEIMMLNSGRSGNVPVRMIINPCTAMRSNFITNSHSITLNGASRCCDWELTIGTTKLNSKKNSQMRMGACHHVSESRGESMNMMAEI